MSDRERRQCARAIRRWRSSHSSSTDRSFYRPPGTHRHVSLDIRQIGRLAVTFALLMFAACAKAPTTAPTLQPLVITQAVIEITATVPPTVIAVFESTDTPAPALTATLIAAPTSPHTPTPTDSPAPTVTPSPTNTPTVTKAPPETPCTPPGGAFANLWQLYFGRLGCPLQSRPATITDAEQVFQNGHMFWWKHLDLHLVVYSQGAKAGTYALYANEWVAGEAQASCTVVVPQGFHQPIRGFGRVWCKLGAGKAAIGWALAPEVSFEAGNADPLVQAFEGGYIFRDSDGFMNRLAYVFFKDGTYVRQSY